MYQLLQIHAVASFEMYVYADCCNVGLLCLNPHYHDDRIAANHEQVSCGVSMCCLGYFAVVEKPSLAAFTVLTTVEVRIIVLDMTSYCRRWPR